MVDLALGETVSAETGLVAVEIVLVEAAPVAEIALEEIGQAETVLAPQAGMIALAGLKGTRIPGVGVGAALAMGPRISTI